jgi:DNA mismatch repair ATPase MutS
LELLRQVGDSPQPAPTLLFLDEPMHATPPTEGAATAMALVHYLAKYSHVRLMITTHYHLLAELERRWPEGFRNISMEATTNPISFSYRLQAGPSFQSIALEMLEKDAFPDALLKDAIEIKNKICMFENNE